jgi:hypothetical protein
VLSENTAAATETFCSFLVTVMGTFYTPLLVQTGSTIISASAVTVQPATLSTMRRNPLFPDWQR